MRPQIKKEVAIYAPAVLLDMKAAKEICQVLISNSTTIRSLNLKGVFFSFEKVSQFDEGASILIAKALLAMQNKTSIAVAFIGYNDDQFSRLKSLFPNKSLPLFSTDEIAMLILGITRIPQNRPIVYFDKDNISQTLIAKELETKGYEVQCVSSKQDFTKARSRYQENAFYIHNIAYDITGNFIPTTIANGIVTYTLYQKADKNVALFFNIQSHNSRLREGYRVFVFDATDTREFSASALDFIMSLALNNVRFEATIAICGLKVPLDTFKLEQCAKSNIVFFKTLLECKQNTKIQTLAKAHKKTDQGRKGLTKHLVAQLPVFINAAIETLSSLTGGEAKRTDYKVTQYTPSGHNDIMGAIIEFEGDVSGEAALLFSKALVKEASMMLLGEECQADTELLDVIKEFTNIIAGRSKAILSDNNVSIGISLPKPYASEKELLVTLKDKQGVQVNLLLNNKPLILFLAH